MTYIYMYMIYKNPAGYKYILIFKVFFSTSQKYFIYFLMFITALFIIIRTWMQPRCLFKNLYWSIVDS